MKIEDRRKKNVQRAFHAGRLHIGTVFEASKNGKDFNVYLRHYKGVVSLNNPRITYTFTSEHDGPVFTFGQVLSHVKLVIDPPNINEDL